MSDRGQSKSQSEGSVSSSSGYSRGTQRTKGSGDNQGDQGQAGGTSASGGKGMSASTTEKDGVVTTVSSSVSSKGSDQSEGQTTTKWKDTAFGGASWARGVVTTGGSQSGSSEVAPDGSSASLSTSGTGSHDVSGGTATIGRLVGGGLLQTDTGYSSKAGGSNATTAGAKDGLLTESTSGGSNGGEATNTTESKGGGVDSASGKPYSTKSFQKITTTSSMKDAEVTGTDKQEWDHQSESSTFNVAEFTPTTLDATSSVTRTKSNGSATETVTRSPEKSSATVTSSGESQTKTTTHRYAISEGWLTHERDDSTHTASGSSNYTSSHDNGPHGAVGGTFSSTTISSTTDKNKSLDRTKSEEGYSSRESEDYTGGTFALSSVSGTYEDTAGGTRRESGSWTNVSTGGGVTKNHQVISNDTRPSKSNDIRTRLSATISSGSYTPEQSTSQAHGFSLDAYHHDSVTDHYDVYGSHTAHLVGDVDEWSLTVNGVSSGRSKGLFTNFGVPVGNGEWDVSWPEEPGEAQPNEPTKGGGEKAQTKTFDFGGVFATTEGDSAWWAGTKAFVGSLVKDTTELVVGEIPVVGDAVAAKEAIQGTNIYGEELSGLERVASAASLIPGGKAVTKAAEGWGAAAKALGNLFGLGGRQTDKLADASKQLNIVDTAGGCFVGDTLVATPAGPRPIRELRVGDTVLAYDHASGRWNPRVVTAVHDNIYEDTLVTVTTDGGVVQATIHHPVWVLAGRELQERPVPHELSPTEDQGQSLPGRWVDSHHLRPGDVLIGMDGERRTVLRLEMEYASALPVFNLTVDGDHTYAVGHAALLVHNTCKITGFVDKGAADVPSAKTAALEDMAREDALLDPHDAEFYGGEGEIYRVPGSDTPSGKPYIGSANDKVERARTARDGRDRSNAITIDRFPIGNNAARRAAEQRAIDDNGGLGSLDNLRNEIAKR